MVAIHFRLLCCCQMEVNLTKGRVAIIDDEDWPLVKSRAWQLQTSGKSKSCYAVSNFIAEGKRGRVFMHRLIAGAKDDDLVDHVNGDTLDNRKANLRLCTREQNQWNTACRKTPNRTSASKGVFYDRTHDRFRAAIRRNGKREYLGYFDTEEEAAEAYAKRDRELSGEFAKGAAV